MLKVVRRSALSRPIQLPCWSLRSMTTAFAFLEALSSLVDMMRGHYDALGVMVLVVSVEPGIPRSPTRRVQRQQQHCVRFPRIYYNMIMTFIPAFSEPHPHWPNRRHHRSWPTRGRGTWGGSRPSGEPYDPAEPGEDRSPSPVQKSCHTSTTLTTWRQKR